MSKVFLKRGDLYTQTEGNFSVMDALDEGIYQIHQNPLTGELFLERIGDKFEFGFNLKILFIILIFFSLELFF